MLAFPLPATAVTNIHFTLQKFVAPAAATNRSVLITPLALQPATGIVAVYDRYRATSDSSGSFTITNVMAGTYQVDVLAPPDRTTFLS